MKVQFYGSQRPPKLCNVQHDEDFNEINRWEKIAHDNFKVIVLW